MSTLSKPQCKETDRLPVTVLSGFLGSGKTTTLTHILNNNAGCKIALIVNDMASVNVDSLAIDNFSKEQLQKSKAKSLAVMPKMVSLQNGCVCCTLREDLVEQIAELAKGDYDYLIIESTGIAEPVPVAQTFCHSLRELEDIMRGYDIGHELGEDAQKKGGRTASDEERKKVAVQAIELQKLTRLDTMVTLVDAAAIWDVLQCNESLRKAEWSKVEAAQAASSPSVAEDLDRSIADLLIAQIEFANMILLNKRDLLVKRKTGDTEKTTDVEIKEEDDSEKSLEKKTELIENLVKTLNPEARVHWTEFGKVSPEWILDTKLFDFEKATVNKGWVRALAGAPTQGEDVALASANNDGPTARQQISSVVFRASRPFHPQRLFDILGGFGHLAENVFSEKTADSTKGEEEMQTEEEKELETAIASTPPRPAEKLSCCGIVLNKEEIETWEKDNAELQAKLEALKQAKVKKEEDNNDPSQTFKNVFRSKGQAWFANCAGHRIMWESVGREFYCAPGRPFDSAVAEAGFDPEELGSAATAAASGFVNHGNDEKINEDPKEQLQKAAAGEMKEQMEENNSCKDENCTAYALTMLVDNLVVNKPAPDQDNLAIYGSEKNSHPVWGDRGTELVFIGVALNEKKIVAALESALVSEEEMELAAADKVKYEECIEKVEKEKGEGAFADLSNEEVIEMTGGLLTRWDRFHDLEDPFFRGEAARKYMEFDLEEDEDMWGEEGDDDLASQVEKEEGETMLAEQDEEMEDFPAEDDSDAVSAEGEATNHSY
ncbi:unnamed protein product [Amoebophrya sp. A120]|nr:unnamed protein product [Amoebophrya sp. A120]|eukprot:GSA120T00020190001.1